MNVIYPFSRWTIFDGSDGYRRPQIAKIHLLNRDNERVIFRLRGRDRAVMLFSNAYGIIEAHSSTVITLVIPPADQWHRDPNDFAGRRIRVVAENLLFPREFGMIPSTQTRINQIGKKIFQTTIANAPLTRVYTKFNLLLPRIPDDWALIELNSTTKNANTPPSNN